ncbi:uncharacterized protein NECHADRAFT_85156 [Fusarium vanettenii 77-13-4]|uniref:Uncharacterized protein n=1 Tax=Fusarium vanettenii (strain ATCC MYA-4622 / CBS 123669 / FGSC 9596 / NRRL 45880 / 77-13-4) TaxID=660122 RepID=C7YV54_FUSV7|nr:uncharacterized protein NECHADRAFT_85156 [Fusarium vanettenii 77-13-4]EEU44521.1 predicted protein [Fusarium vanettenii 77-13-4]
MADFTLLQGLPHINLVNITAAAATPPTTTTTTNNNTNSDTENNNMVRGGSNRDGSCHHYGPTNTGQGYGSGNPGPPQSDGDLSSLFDTPPPTAPSNDGRGGRGRRRGRGRGRGGGSSGGVRGGRGGGSFHGSTQTPPAPVAPIAQGQQSTGNMSLAPLNAGGYQFGGLTLLWPPPDSTHGYSPAVEASQGSGHGQQAQNFRGQDERLQVVEELGVKTQPAETPGQVDLSLSNASKRGGAQENIVSKVSFTPGAVVSYSNARDAKRAIDEIAGHDDDNTAVNLTIWLQPKKRRIEKDTKLTVSQWVALSCNDMGIEVPEGDVPEVDAETVDAADAEGIAKCPNCKVEGHGIVECMMPRRDGYVHGCIHCSTAEHQTAKCDKHPRDTAKLVDLLVKQRPNMPPLKATPWYPALHEYMEVASLEAIESFPWRAQFGIEVIQDPLLRRRAVESIEKGRDFRPVDPKMTDWVTIRERDGKPKSAMDGFPKLGTQPQGGKGPSQKWSKRQPPLSQKWRKAMIKHGQADPNNLPCGDGFQFVPGV